MQAGMKRRARVSPVGQKAYLLYFRGGNGVSRQLISLVPSRPCSLAGRGCRLLALGVDGWYPETGIRRGNRQAAKVLTAMGMDANMMLTAKQARVGKFMLVSTSTRAVTQGTYLHEVYTY